MEKYKWCMSEVFAHLRLDMARKLYGHVIGKPIEMLLGEISHSIIHVPNSHKKIEKTFQHQALMSRDWIPPGCNQSWGEHSCLYTTFQFKVMKFLLSGFFLLVLTVRFKKKIMILSPQLWNTVLNNVQKCTACIIEFGASRQNFIPLPLLSHVFSILGARFISLHIEKNVLMSAITVGQMGWIVHCFFQIGVKYVIISILFSVLMSI